MALSTEQAPTGQLKRPYFHWVWKPAGQPNASWKWQLFGYYWRETPRRLNLVFSFRGLLLWSASLSFAAYLIGAAVIVGIWSRNPYNQVGYLDVVLPTRWAELRALRGRGLIAEGVAEIKAKRYAIGIMRLRQGLARAPQDFNGRLELARVFVLLGRLNQAQQFLAEGLNYEQPPRAYRDMLLALTIYIEDFDQALHYVEVLQKGASEETVRDLVGWQARTLERLGRSKDLESLRNKLRAGVPSIEVEAAWARSQLESENGSPQLALSEILKDRARFGTAPESLALQIELASACHDFSSVEEGVRLWLEEDPAGSLPRIHEIVARCSLGQDAIARSKIVDFFVSYAADPAAGPLLLKELTNARATEYLKFAFTEAQSAGAASVPTRICYVQGLMLAGEFTEARIQLTAVEDLIKSSKIKDTEWSLAARRLLDAVQSPGDSTNSLLVDYLETRKMNPDGFRFVWRVLARGQSPVIADATILARNRFPGIRFAKDETSVLARIASLRPPDRGALASTQVQLKSPPPSEPPRTRITPASVQKSLRQIEDFIARGDFAGAKRELVSIDRVNIDEFRGEIALLRLKIYGELGEFAELTSALHIYLRSPSANQATLRRLAERWNNPKQRDSALTLLRETYSKFPSANWTIDLRREIERALLVAPAANITSPRN